MRIFKWGVLALLFFCVFAFLFISVQWTRARGAGAPYEGSYEVAGVDAGVRIVRDAMATPHIIADNADDAYFALGFVHAQDRLWQMDLTRRSTQGRLAEIFGAAAVESDIWHRSLQFASNVEKSWAALPAEDQRRLEAYARGVNAWMLSGDFRKPAEYIFTLTNPEEWKPTDSLYVHKAIWVTLSLNLRTETTRARLRNGPSTRIVDAYLPDYPADGHVAMAWEDLARTLGLDPAIAAAPADEDAAAAVFSDPASENSNNWVVSGERTRSGAPMLADDPHLGLTMPGFWQLAHLKINGDNVFGATIPGIPAVIVGRNDHISWGVTNNRTDVQDVYLEKLNPDDPMQYATPEGWARFDAHEETIRVRFGRNVTRQFLRSRHGPVLSDETTAGMADPAVHRLALQWTGNSVVDTTISAMMNNHKTSTTEEFISILRENYVGPVQNLVFAHADGTTGLMVVGLAPIRSEAHETRGRAPAAGENPANDWTGFIPPELAPLVIDPSSGAIVTANAKTTPDEYPYLRALDFANPSRQQRIQDLLDATPEHNVDSFRSIHMDLGTTNVEPLKRLMLRATTDDPHEVRALDILRAWDGRWTAEAEGPLVYAMWTREFTRVIAEDDMAEDFERYFQYAPEFLAHVLEADLAEVCDDLRTDALETCDNALRASLSAATAALNKEYGPALSQPWGRTYVTRHGHLGLGDFPIIGDILSRNTPRATGPDAPNVGYFDFRPMPTKVGGGHGASLRMIFDMSDVAASWFALPNGQSGHFRSPHYDDLQAGWLAGEYFRIPIDIDGIESPRVITLNPTE